MKIKEKFYLYFILSSIIIGLLNSSNPSLSFIYSCIPAESHQIYCSFIFSQILIKLSYLSWVMKLSISLHKITFLRRYLNGI